MLWVTAAVLALLLAVGGETGKTKKTFEQTVRDLKDRQASIHYDVKTAESNESGEQVRKHLVLTYHDQGKEMETELFPLDLHAFVEHGLAEEDALWKFVSYALTTRFVLDAESNGSTLIATIDRKKNDVIVKQDKIPYTILQAGDIGCVSLSKEKGWLAPLLKKSTEEEKLYYVRVPFKLFPKLHGDLLEKHAGSPLHGYSRSPCHIKRSLLSCTDCTCLAISFGSGERTKMFAAPLYGSGNEHYFTASELIEMEKPEHSTWVLDYYSFPWVPTKDSHVQYVIAGSLESNGIELDDHKQHVGRSPSDRPAGDVLP